MQRVFIFLTLFSITTIPGLSQVDLFAGIIREYIATGCVMEAYENSKDQLSVLNLDTTWAEGN